MYVIDVRTYELKPFVDETQVPGGYAILSHRWEDEEVLYKDVTKPKRRQQMHSLKGFYKFEKTCQQALQDGLSYAWIDTCCIDKSSSAELQEAINSMFRWYQHATVCYAYLSDIHHLDDIVKSKWFTRGWTLQELLAPTQLVFYDAIWTKLAKRKNHAEKIACATHIPVDILNRSWSKAIYRPCAAQILSWASTRSTSRVEDASYCLLGLFNVNMPLLYGEGNKAFTRLQHEILRQSDDQSLFAWVLPDNVEPGSHTPDLWGLLAPSPQFFNLPLPLRDGFLSVGPSWKRRKAHTFDSEGISAEVFLVCIQPRLYIAILNAEVKMDSCYLLSIILKRLDHQGHFARCHMNVDTKLWSPYGGARFSDIRKGVALATKYFKGELQIIKVVNTPGEFGWGALFSVARNDVAIKVCPFKVSIDRTITPHKSIYEVVNGTVCLSNPSPDSIGLAAYVKCEHAVNKGGPPLSPASRPPVYFIGIGFDAEFCPIVVLTLNQDKLWQRHPDKFLAFMDHCIGRSTNEVFIKELSWTTQSQENTQPKELCSYRASGRRVMFTQFKNPLFQRLNKLYLNSTLLLKPQLPPTYGYPKRYEATIHTTVFSPVADESKSGLYVIIDYDRDELVWNLYIREV